MFLGRKKLFSDDVKPDTVLHPNQRSRAEALSQDLEITAKLKICARAGLFGMTWIMVFRQPNHPRSDDLTRALNAAPYFQINGGAGKPMAIEIKASRLFPQP